MLNYQVPPTAEKADPAAVGEAIRTIVLAEDGYREVSSASEADYSVVIGPPHGRGWVGIYEETADASDLTAVETTASALSDALKRPIVAATVDDGEDRLELRLCRRGEMADRFSVSGASPVAGSSQHGGLSASELAGQPDKWRPVLDANRTVEELEEAFARRDVPARELIREIADLLGQDPVFASTSAASLQVLAAGDLQRLHFARSEGATSLERVGGIPQFELADTVDQRETSVGEALQVSTSVGNRGGRADGFDIVLSGDAIEHGLLEVDSIRIMGGRGGEQEEIPAEIEERDGRRVAVAHFPARTLDAALASEVDLSEMSESSQQRYMDAHRATRLTVYASLRAAEEGTGTLRLGIVGHTAPESHAAVATEITVTPRPRQPLHVDLDVVKPHELRQLQKDNTLFAVAHFDGPIDDWTDAATGAFSAWSSAIAQSDEMYTAVTLAEASSRPSETDVPAADFDNPSRLDRLAEQLPGLHRYTALLHPIDIPRGRRRAPTTAGFSFFSGALAFREPTDQSSPSLGFWVDVSKRDDAEINELRATLRDIIDTLAQDAPMLQAILDRWDWAPDRTVRNMPYESACGVIGTDHLRRDWLRSHLRAAAETSWIRTDQLTDLDNDALSTVVDREHLDAITRLTLRPDADLDALERAIAPLLPAG